MADAEPQAADAPDASIDADAQPQLISGGDAFADALGSIAAGSRLELCIQSYDLDRRIYGRPTLVEGIRQFLLQHERATLRVLVHSPKRTAQTGGHRLVELARSLSSRAQIRALPESKKELRQDMIVGDSRMLLLRQRPDDLDAQFHGGDPRVARRKAGEFAELWEQAEPAQELRALGI